MNISLINLLKVQSATCLAQRSPHFVYRLPVVSRSSFLQFSGVGRCTKSKLVLKPNAKPIFRKACAVPYAAFPRLSQDIDRLVAPNVLSPADHAQWAVIVAAMQMKNGSIQLFSTRLNDTGAAPIPTTSTGRYHHKVERRPLLLPTRSRRGLPRVGNGRKLQATADDQHRGVFSFNRLLSRVKPAP